MQINITPTSNSKNVLTDLLAYNTFDEWFKAILDKTAKTKLRILTVITDNLIYTLIYDSVNDKEAYQMIDEIKTKIPKELLNIPSNSARIDFYGDAEELVISF